MRDIEDGCIELIEPEDSFPEAELRRRNPMLWWYRHQINPIREILGLTEFDFIYPAVLKLKQEVDRLRAEKNNGDA